LTGSAEQYLSKARRCLADAQSILAIHIPDVAAKEAYLAAFHAAEALIVQMTGRAPKTHRGVRTEFARLARDDATLAVFTEFLAGEVDRRLRCRRDR